MSGPTNETRLFYPWWYSFVKWVLPVGIAFSVSLLLALALTGLVTVPASFGLLAWAPVFFSSLEGLASVAVLSVAVFASFSMTAIGLSIFMRGLILPVSEDVANQYQIKNTSLERSISEIEKGLARRDAEFDHALIEIDKRGQKITNKYHQLIGSMRAHGLDPNKFTEPPKNAAAPEAENDPTAVKP